LATLKDLARESGLSLTTVASILRGDRARFPETTIRKVEATAYKLKYRPNTVSRAMRKGHTGVILLVNGRRAGALTSVSVFLGGLMDAVSDEGWRLVVEQADEPSEGHMGDLRFVKEQYYDGMILNIQSFQKVAVEALEKALNRFQVPAVWFNHKVDRGGVHPDEIGAGAALADRLFQLGKRRIFFVGLGSKAIHFSAGDRRQGLLEAMEKNRQVLAGEAATLTEASPGAERSQFDRSLQRLRGDPDSVDAVVLSHEFLLPRFLLATGWDSSRLDRVCAFDCRAASLQNVPLRGTAIPWAALGREAVAMLKSQRGHSSPKKSIILPHTLTL